MIELFESRRQVAHGASKPVELPDEDAIDLAAADAGHRGIELRAALSAAGNGMIAVLSDDSHARAFGVRAQSVMLQVRLPAGRGDAEIERRANFFSGHFRWRSDQKCLPSRSEGSLPFTPWFFKVSNRCRRSFSGRPDRDQPIMPGMRILSPSEQETLILKTFLQV